VKHPEIREKFLKFFEEKGHKVVPSSSLLPTDSSVLFTTAGMQQFKDFYSGKVEAMENFKSLNVASNQKCMRTSGIDEVGDTSHLTFFEMLGNFSFGGYWKKEAIEYAYNFITKEMGLRIDYVSIFGGEPGLASADVESEEIWRSLDPDLKIKKMGRSDNFWGPTGDEGPCGPSTEIYVNGIEIWNIVFNQYYKHSDGNLEPLKIKGIDTGMGLERLAMVIQKKENIFETDLFEPLIQILPEDSIPDRVHRIITDHSRAIAFLISDGIKPSNKEQGYVLRRLIRRVIVQCHLQGIELEAVNEIFEKISELYSKYYPELNLSLIKSEFKQENEKFQKTFKNGLKEMEKLNSIDGVGAFKLYESFGLPFEVIQEVGGDKTKNLTREDFESERKRHQEISRAGVEKKFGGHGIKEGDLTAADTIEMQKKIRLHTATHIIVAALQKILDQKLPQAGSDITAERLRFDFIFSRKITPEELKAAEDMANDVVRQNLPVTMKEMDLQEALDSGASGVFKNKYASQVKVYTIGDEQNWFSRELCGGPHVKSTAEIGHIKITKEESVSGGARRIRAVIDK
jgi:alanyl-tRNA synthetase